MYWKNRCCCRCRPSSGLRCSWDGCCFCPGIPADQLTVAYLPSLADTLRAAGKHINGFFDGATAELAGDHLTISLAHGGYEWLERENCARVISEILEQEFGAADHSGVHRRAGSGVQSGDLPQNHGGGRGSHSQGSAPPGCTGAFPVRLLPRTAAMAAGTEAAMATAAGTVRAADAGATAVCWTSPRRRPSGLMPRGCPSRQTK